MAKRLLLAGNHYVTANVARVEKAGCYTKWLAGMAFYYQHPTPKNPIQVDSGKRCFVCAASAQTP